MNKEELKESRARLQSLIAIAKEDEVIVDRIRQDRSERWRSSESPVR